MFNEEISSKHKLVWTLVFNVTSLKNDLKCVLSFIDFIHITTAFLTSNNKNILKYRKVQGKKISKLCFYNSYYESLTSHDREKVLFKFFNYSLLEQEKSLLSRVLNFVIPPKNLNYADYLLLFELLFRDIDFCEIPSYDKEFMRSRVRNCAFTSVRDLSKINENNLSKKEQLALKDLIKSRDLVIQKADKGITVAILDKNDYISKMNVILSDSSKSQKLPIDQNKVLNHIVHMESRITDVLRKLKNKKIIYEKKYEDLYLVGSSPGILYGRTKIHKDVKDVVPPFRPILSAIGTPTYELSKLFVPLLTPLTLNKYTIKDSFWFAEKLLNNDSILIMTSFYFESLFTNILLQETIDLCVELLFNNKPNIDGFTITDFHELLTVTTSESLFLFDGEYYKQIDGVAMSFPLGRTLPILFLVIINKCGPKIVFVNLNLSFLKDMLMTHFCYFDQKIILKNFNVTLIANILTCETEESSSISSLNIKIRRVNNSFSASIYRKLTFSGIFRNFESFIPVSYKSNLIFMLSFRAFKFFIKRFSILRTFLKEMVILIILLTFVSKYF